MEAEKWLIARHSAARRLIVMWALILGLVTTRRPSQRRLAVSLDATGSAPIVTRVFSFALPLSGAEPGMEIPFFVSGFVLSQEGANGHLLFSVNDQTWSSIFQKTRTTISSSNSTTKSALRPSFGLTSFS
jgi:hypothetical protein